MIDALAVQHVGVPVSSIERSLEFYRKVFGVTPEFIAEGSGEEVSKALGVDNAVISFAFLRIGPTTLELLEYKNPRGREFDRRNCDVGAIHIAFKVADIDDAYRTLVSEGLTFNAPPIRIGEGPLAGCAFVYFSDPDGVQLELFEEN